MSRREHDEEREHRITYEAIVDAYGEEEQTLGWYYYLEDKIQFPFDAECIEKSSISPLKVGEKVTVIEMADEDDCTLQEMYVIIEFLDRTFGVPLSQLKPLNVDERTQEAVEDWHYWVGRREF